MKTSKLVVRLLAANDKAIESLDKQLESVQKQMETVDPDDKARKLDLQAQKVELEKRKLKLSPQKEKEKAMTIKRVVARLQETASSMNRVATFLKSLGLQDTVVQHIVSKKSSHVTAKGFRTVFSDAEPELVLLVSKMLTKTLGPSIKSTEQGEPLRQWVVPEKGKVYLQRHPGGVYAFGLSQQTNPGLW